MKFWNFKSKRSRSSRPQSLVSPPEFASRLREEQQRSDRSGLSFVLATLLIEDPQQGSEKTALLGKLCNARLRETDFVGVLEAAKIGVILPYTLEAGARHAIDDIQEMAKGDIQSLHCEFFEYPKDSMRGPSEGLGEADVQHADDLALTEPFAKRAMDVALSFTALVLLSPLVLLAAVAIRITSAGPVFFLQRREGKHGRVFRMWKLRTMFDGAESMQGKLREFSEQDGPAFKLANDPRITPLGRWLRTTSIDEIPQLWNVLLGDMSLVGPRPLPVHESQACRSWQRRRLAVRPGITCIWQISGRSSVSFDEWIRMDLEYIKSRSTTRDVQLLLQTVPAVLGQRGAK